MGGGRGRVGSAGGNGGGGAGAGGGGGAGAGGGGGADLTTMNDQQLADFTTNAMEANIPSNQYESTTQQLINAAGWNGKPEVVSDAQLKKLAKKQGAVVLYRTVTANDEQSLTAGQIANSFRNGAENNIGGWGGQAFGGGHYFSNRLDGSRSYAYGASSAVTIGAVLNKRAKVIDADDLRGAKGQNWLSQHPTAAKAMGFKYISSRRRWVDSGPALKTKGGIRLSLSENAYTTLAMSMGYNVVSNTVDRREKYYTIMDRQAVTTSNTNYYNASKELG